ncbi:MAG: ParB/RepB/Spo0J family partition protein [Clostridia bacterium]|nr:ParB/RepB/Spo0J family partition protein [Clostridia bacterium]
MASKKGLGRGLDILLPESDAPVGSTEISLSDIDPNPDQPRRVFDKEALETLAESIRQSGLLQPLLVAPEGSRYRIVAGERRFRAARMAGLDTVPCVVREMSEQERREAALIENLQREDLNPIEEAAGIRDLMESCGYTQELAAKRVGRSRPAVANLLRLLALPESIQEMVKDGRLSAGHARVLAGLENEQLQQALAERILRDGLSVREAEKLAAAPVEPPQKPEKKPLALELEDMRSRLQSVLGVRTTLTGNAKRGRVILQYGSEEELETIYAALERLEKN